MLCQRQESLREHLIRIVSVTSTKMEASARGQESGKTTVFGEYRNHDSTQTNLDSPMHLLKFQQVNQKDAEKFLNDVHQLLSVRSQESGPQKSRAVAVISTTSQPESSATLSYKLTGEATVHHLPLKEPPQGNLLHHYLEAAAPKPEEKAKILNTELFVPAKCQPEPSPDKEPLTLLPNPSVPASLRNATGFSPAVASTKQTGVASTEQQRTPNCGKISDLFMGSVNQLKFKNTNQSQLESFLINKQQNQESQQ